MLFNSLEFLIFLPIVFLLYWFVFKPLKWQNFFVVAASYLFYGWWDIKFLILIAGISGVSFASGLLIERWAHRQACRRVVLWISVAICLATLGAFKYFDFFAKGFARIAATVGWSVDSVTLGLLLPVGISFYTFQALSYTIDVYRREIAPTRNAIAFFAFISFFPQLVAGPIERATNLLPQFLKPRHFDYAKAVRGMRLILWGLFKKMVVADNAAEIVNHVFGNYAEAGTTALWLAALLFTFQVYCDFSGYSDIAIGTARLFGIRLSRNFAFPLFSRSISEFWRRWHISLTTWFKDYLYFPLGGSRTSKLKTARNTAVTFVVSGLWHGANYTYIAWGAIHAALLMPGVLIDRLHKRRYRYDPTDRRLIVPFSESTAMAITFMLFLLSLVVFRAPTLHIAAHCFRTMFSATTAAPWFVIAKGHQLALTLGAVGTLVILEWITRHRESPIDFAGKGIWRFKAMRWTAYILLFAITVIMAGAPADFIYFQF